MSTTVATPVTQHPVLGQVVQVDPATLVIGENVRRTAEHAALVASIKERGVLTPVTAYVDAYEQLVVEHGQRRVLAAVDANRQTVPVYVVPKPQEADRIVDQVSENVHRAPIGTADQVRAWQQLAGFGLTARQISKRTATPRADVELGLQVAASTAAADTVEAVVSMTLQQAAVITEFDDDPDAVSSLVAAVDSGFDHVAQRLRDERADHAARTTLERELADAGVRVVDTPPGAGSRSQWLLNLKTGSKNTTVGNHADCPGHAAYLRRRYHPTVKDDRGNPTIAYEADYLCTDWRKHGHADRYGAIPRNTPPAAEQTPAEREAAAAERRRVIAGNQAWRSATTVRRAWLRGFVLRSDVGDAHAERFIAESLASGDHQLRQAFEQHHAFYTGLHLLDGDASDYLVHQQRRDALVTELATASRARALAITAGLILAAWEAGAADTLTWRRPDDALAKRSLNAMTAWGYELAPIEAAIVTGDPWVEP